MVLSTTITPEKIAINLGRATPDDGSVIESQWKMWIKDALMLIQIRADGLAVTDVPQAKLDYVIREAVSDHIKRPDNATQVTVAVDDGSTTKTYQSGAGRVTITEDWWMMLGLSARKGKAFETDTMPADATPGEVLDYSLYYEPGWYPIGSNGIGEDWS